MNGLEFPADEKKTLKRFSFPAHNDCVSDATEISKVTFFRCWDF